MTFESNITALSVLSPSLKRTHLLLLPPNRFSQSLWLFLAEIKPIPFQTPLLSFLSRYSTSLGYLLFLQCPYWVLLFSQSAFHPSHPQKKWPPLFFMYSSQLDEHQLWVSNCSRYWDKLVKKTDTALSHEAFSWVVYFKLTVQTAFSKGFSKKGYQLGIEKSSKDSNKK